MRTDAAVEDLCISSLLHPLAAGLATSRFMAIQNDPITTFNDVFLKMLSGGGFLEDPDDSRAVRTFFRCRHVHGPVVLRGRFSKPTRMADRGSTLLLVRYWYCGC